MGTRLKKKQSPANPWLDTDDDPTGDGSAVLVAEADEAPEFDQVLGYDDVAEGTPVPLHGGPTAQQDALSAPEVATLTILGLHGGAGSSTLGQLLADVDDLQVAPYHWDEGDPLPAGWTVAVARINGRGLAQALTFTRSWSQGNLGDRGRLLGLVLVDDAPKPSKEQLAQAKLLTGAVPKTWRIPWVEAWRTHPADEDAPAAPRRVRATTKNIRSTHGAAAN